MFFLNDSMAALADATTFSPSVLGGLSISACAMPMALTQPPLPNSCHALRTASGASAGPFFDWLMSSSMRSTILPWASIGLSTICTLPVLSTRTAAGMYFRPVSKGDSLVHIARPPSHFLASAKACTASGESLPTETKTTWILSPYSSCSLMDIGTDVPTQAPQYVPQNSKSVGRPRSDSRLVTPMPLSTGDEKV